MDRAHARRHKFPAMAGGEDDIAVLDLPLAAFPAQLAHRFCEAREVAKMIAGQQSARGIDWDRAAGPDCAGFHEWTALALFAPSVVFHLEQDLAGKAIVELGAIDVFKCDVSLSESLRLG